MSKEEVREIRDETYHKLSGFAYFENPRKKQIINYSDGKQTWETITSKKFKLHDPDTGFDAMVSRNDNNIIVAFRGTQGDKIVSLRKGLDEGWKDVVADVEYVVMSEKVNKLGLDVDLSNHKLSIDFHEKNQFRQADKLVKEIKKEYPNCNISLTGHSLGGALASYSAAVNDVSAVTYNSPSVVGLLPKDMQADVNKGKYDKQIINYVHPKDAISSGAFNPYERHIGSTYYAGFDFELENAETKYNPLSRLKSTVAEDNYHSLKHYIFDDLGNINNPILTNVLTGETMYQSPRMFSPSMVTIEVTPDHLTDTAKKLQEYLGRMEEICNKLKREASVLDNIKQSEHVLDEVLQSVHDVNGWFSENTSEIVHNLNSASSSFVKADVLK
jgi:predicted esterase YcpF (UPF0227 family)